MACSKIACFLCGRFAGNTFADVVRHIGYVHACQPNFLVTCGLQGCKRQYKSYMAYRFHLYQAHGDVIKGGSMSVEVLQPLSDSPTCTSSLDDMDVVG